MIRHYVAHRLIAAHDRALGAYIAARLARRAGADSVFLPSSRHTGQPRNRAPGLAIDGNPDTYRVSSGTKAGQGPTPSAPIALGVDFGAPETIGSVIMIPRLAYDPTAYSIQVSSDDLAWSTVATVPSAPNGTVTTSFTPVTAQYLRLLIADSYDTTDRNVQVAVLQPSRTQHSHALGRAVSQSGRGRVDHSGEANG